MPKKSCPGGFRLTLKAAKMLAIQEFGTCKGLKQAGWSRATRRLMIFGAGGTEHEACL